LAPCRFQIVWRWKLRNRSGRPAVALEIRRLIREMSIADPLWGAPRIHGELLKRGIEIGQTSVAKYMARRRGPPSQGGRRSFATLLERMQKEPGPVERSAIVIRDRNAISSACAVYLGMRLTAEVAETSSNMPDVLTLFFVVRGVQAGHSRLAV